MKAPLFVLPAFLISCSYFFEEQPKPWSYHRYVAWSANAGLVKAIHEEQMRELINSAPRDKFMLMIDGEWMDCEEGSTLELSCCSQYIADSLKRELDDLYNSLIIGIDAEIKSATISTNPEKPEYDEVIEEEIRQLEKRKENLAASQRYFLKYLKNQKKLAALMIGGNEQFIHEAQAEITLLENRIEELRWLFEWW